MVSGRSTSICQGQPCHYCVHVNRSLGGVSAVLGGLSVPELRRGLVAWVDRGLSGCVEGGSRGCIREGDDKGLREWVDREC